jgi:hypothetical protein
MRTLPLNTFASAILTGGTGTTSVGPTASGEVWTVTIIGVRCATNVLESICQVYLNGSLIGTTTWGSTGDSDTGITLTVCVGQEITASWTGADSGTTGFLTVLGTRVV